MSRRVGHPARLQPYYAEWVRQAGGQGPLYEYIIWIGRKHAEFNAQDREGWAGREARFQAWLESRPVEVKTGEGS